jgi:tripartite-type tricarboxylate transporter receptor subunit TctC
MRAKWMAASLCWLAVLAFSQLTAHANEPAPGYPSKPVQLVVPFAAGGSSDALMRLLAQFVSKQWKQPIIVDNRPGASGAIAGEYVVRQPADGYTLMNVGPTSLTALGALRRDLPYDPMKDLVLATLLQVIPNLLVINPKKVDVQNVQGLIDYAKANPGKLSYASTGIGSTGHLAVELLKILTGTDMVHITYRGNGPALNDLVAGTVDLTIDGASSVGSQVNEGRLRALGVTTAKRISALPDLPTVAETVPGFEAETWNGLAVRTGTPRELVEKINHDFNIALREPEVIKWLTSLRTEPVGSSLGEARTFAEADQARWARVVKELKLNPEQK